jgi:hypothetical protein
VPTIVASVLSTFDNKGLKKGKKEVSAFEKQIKTFGKTFAAVFSARALFNYSKNAVKAFAADEKAAKSLELQLKNTGFAFSAPSVEYFIANLQKTTGVLDDQLRPAFQQLLTVTGSITKSQEALGVALNISAATGKSLTEVSAALTRGFSGNTAGLSRLGAGISKATLKAGDMDAILAELNTKFTGQSAARLTTYAGKMDLLKVASENVKEEIGKGIIGALDALSKDTSIEDTALKMENLGKTLADVITGVGVLIAELQKIPGVKQVTGALFDISVFGSLARLARMNAQPAELPFNKQRSAGRISAQVFRTEVRQQKELDRLRALEIAKLKAKTEIDKLRDKFDLERIGLTAALNAATDEETKLRIRAQLAILDNNEALAKKYNAELEGAAAADKLSKSLNTAASFLDILAGRPNPLFTTTGEKTPRGEKQIAPFEGSTTFTVPQGVTNQGGQAGGGNTASTPTQATLEIAPNASADRLVQAIAETVRVNLKYGNKLLPAGGID